jgi:hypothetical protein
MAERMADAAIEEARKLSLTKGHMALDLLEDLIETEFLVQEGPEFVLNYINSKPPRLGKSLRRLELAFDWGSDDWGWASPGRVRELIGLNEICLPDYELRKFFEFMGSTKKKKGLEFLINVPTLAV